MAWEGTTKRLPAIAAQGSEPAGAALTSDGTCSTRRMLKDVVSFMALEGCAGMNHRKVSWGSEAQQNTRFYGFSVDLVGRAENSGKFIEQPVGLVPISRHDIGKRARNRGVEHTRVRGHRDWVGQKSQRGGSRSA